MGELSRLILENGMVFGGKAFGRVGDVVAETVFATGMTGYLETLTDPSYYGQTVIQTFPLIGNYGVIPADFESDNIFLSGYIVKDWCQEPSNFRNEGALDAFLYERGICGLYGVDTRTITRVIRSAGVMNGKIKAGEPNSADFDEIRAYSIKRAVESVTTKETRYYDGGGKKRVVLLDFGVKGGIVRELNKRGCDVWVMPAETAPDEVFEVKPDGVMLSNGPGDPAENVGIVENLKKLMSRDVPIFGICLGHQLLAIANGFKTEKLKYGHRGANQPVKNLTDGKVYITSQNHGYAVIYDKAAEKASARQLFANVNDGTCEGIEYDSRPVFTAQFHPEACSGPRDTGFLFDRFIKNMEGGAA